MDNDPVLPAPPLRTLADLESSVRVPFDRLVSEQAEPPTPHMFSEDEQIRRTVLFDVGG